MLVAEGYVGPGSVAAVDRQAQGRLGRRALGAGRTAGRSPVGRRGAGSAGAGGQWACAGEAAGGGDGLRPPQYEEGEAKKMAIVGLGAI